MASQGIPIRIVINVDRLNMPGVSVTRSRAVACVVVTAHPSPNFISGLTGELETAAAMLDAAGVSPTAPFKIKMDGVDLDEIDLELLKQVRPAWENIQGNYAVSLDFAPIADSEAGDTLPSISALSPVNLSGITFAKSGDMKLQSGVESKAAHKKLDPEAERNITGMVKTIVQHIRTNGANPDFDVSKPDALKKVYNYIKSTTASRTVSDDVAEVVRQRVIPLIR
ncbi:MAG: hypothetical protein KGL39_10965 [Patescibacteria group bacterium]|nr:hypothetical protein [Patescibacteria group bacterium]